MPNLALHHFTVVDTSPIEVIELAALNHCDAVCVFVEDEPSGTFPAVTRENLADVKQALDDSGVSVTNIEYFPLTDNPPWDRYERMLDLGVELGARLGVTHIHDTETNRALAALGRLTELAAQRGLLLGLEFMGITPGCTSFEAAVACVNQSNNEVVGVAIDALHFFRTGGEIAAIEAQPPSLFAYAQLCDGPELDDPAMALDLDRYRNEAFQRLLPGEGEFPLTQLIQALPAELHYDVEVPMPSLAAQGVSARDRATEAIEAARALLATRR